MPPLTPPVGRVPMYARDPLTGNIYEVGGGGTNEVFIGTTDPYITSANSTDELWLDTTTTPPVLKGRVGGQWVAVVSSEPPLDEVWVGTTSPDPAGTYEMWVDTNTDPAVLRFKNQIGQWLPIGGGSGADEVWVGPDDPDVIEPGTTRELWYDTDEIAPPGASVTLQWWDPLVNYVVGSTVLWSQADTALWRANAANIGQEPGVTQNVGTAYDFPGGGVFGLSAPLAQFIYNSGVDITVDTGGTYGTAGPMVVLGDQRQVVLERTASGFSLTVKTTAGQTVASGSTTERFLRAKVQSTVSGLVALQASPDGATWTDIHMMGMPGGTTADLGQIATIHLGHDNISAGYDGVLADVTTTDYDGAALRTSWVPTTQGPNGGGPSPVTGEVYTVLPGTVLTPVNPVALPSPWDWIADISGQKLPLAGGTMDPGAVIQFQNETVPKINLYANTFGLGVEGGTTTLYGSSRVRFRIGTPTDTAVGGLTSPDVASVDVNGFIHNGVWVPNLKVINNVNIVVGHWYEVATCPYHRTVRLRFGAIGPGKPTRSQSLDANIGFLADEGEGASTYSGYLSVFGHLKGNQPNNKIFDSIGVGPEKIWIRCSQAATIQVGIEAYDTASGARFMLSMADGGTAPGVWDSVAL